MGLREASTAEGMFQLRSEGEQGQLWEGSEGWGVGMCGPYPERRTSIDKGSYGRREHALLEELKEKRLM